MKNYLYPLLGIGFLLLCFACTKSNDSVQKKKITIYLFNDGDTIKSYAYDLPPSIEESLPVWDITFSDSVLLAWNQASIENITRENSRYLDDCLRERLQIYEAGDYWRLAFCKDILNNDYLREPDFEKGFDIIEEVCCGETTSHCNYLIINRHDKIRVLAFTFHNRHARYYLRDVIVLEKEKYEHFFESIIKQDGDDEMGLPYQEFHVTRFSKDKIDSYISGCTMRISCINEFMDMIQF
ncbi:MAG: hypothetical protein LBU22_02305 [Dysgonamonadaceae bacterium]|jgi:hypothetical protein|nr:hypothetical protein [Dysgonamonadaceae bacterium]